MATIIKRGKKYAVVYYYTDENGVQRQKWEPPVDTKKEAQKRLNEIQYEMDHGTFIRPSCMTVRDFLSEFVEMYGTKKWGLSMYSSNMGLIRNYINPIIGDIYVQDVDAMVVDKFISKLQKTKAVSFRGRKPKSEFVSACTIEKINKLMRCAFERAIRWGMVGKNPFIGAALPKYGLVIALDNGRPCEDRVIGQAFNRLKKKANLPDVVFHSLRHSSTTYKLKLNHGDIKATQGDTGHAQPDMVTEVYAHILEEDRKVNAQRFETGFYSRPDLRGAEKALREEAGCKPTAELLYLLIGLQDKPELVSFLSELVKQKQL